MTSILRRLAMPVLGLAAAASMATACSSSTIGGTGLPGGSIGASSNGAGGSSSGDFGSGSGSASVPSGGAGAASSSDDGGGGGGASTGDAAFCDTFRTKLATIQNAGSDPTTAADTFDALVAVAPPVIKADTQYVATALHDALAGKIGDPTKIEQATERITRYYVTNCH